MAQVRLATVLLLVAYMAYFGNCKHLSSVRYERSIWDLGATLYADVWSAADVKAAQTACKAVGYARRIGPIQVKQAGLFDGLLPNTIANALGQIHAAVVPESMQESFCKQVGLGKGVNHHHDDYNDDYRRRSL